MARSTTTTIHHNHGLHPFLIASNILIWISAAIVMGIAAFWIATLREMYLIPPGIIYTEAISALTVLVFFAAFFLGRFTDALLLFNGIFSYLWLVIVVFTADSGRFDRLVESRVYYKLYHEKTSGLYSPDPTARLIRVLVVAEAFSFIAFFSLFFNVVFNWYLGYRDRTSVRTTSQVQGQGQ